LYSCKSGLTNNLNSVNNSRFQQTLDELTLKLLHLERICTKLGKFQRKKEHRAIAHDEGRLNCGMLLTIGQMCRRNIHVSDERQLQEWAIVLEVLRFQPRDFGDVVPAAHGDGGLQMGVPLELARFGFG
jgi:hypothetical protein